MTTGKASSAHNQLRNHRGTTLKRTANKLALSPDLRVALAALAAAEGITLSALVRDGLDRHRGRTC
jgi:hypothetical protein